MESLLHIQGNPDSNLTALFLIHAISGLALPYLGLGNLSDDASDQLDNARPVYGVSSPTYKHQSYQLPRSLDEIAREYISLIQREIQPEGPYLLGGWSMGGMIAMKMAAILESQDEEVLHVLLVDSINPEKIPAFSEPMEHELITSLTYNNMVKHTSLPLLAGESSGESSSGSQDEEDMEEEEVGLHQLLPRMRAHIFNGLKMIGNVPPGMLSREQLRSPVTLIKCSSLAKLHPALSNARKGVIHKNFNDDCLGWATMGLRSIPLEAQHDRVLDRRHVGDLTAIMRRALKDVRR